MCGQQRLFRRAGDKLNTTSAGLAWQKRDSAGSALRLTHIRRPYLIDHTQPTDQMKGKITYQSNDRLEIYFIAQ